MTQLIIDNVKMQFGKRLLFSITHLNFKQGQTIFLKGHNGTGKTTLMKILAGLIKPTQGQIIWNNETKPTWWNKFPQLGHVVYLHQHPYLFEGSVKHNLGYSQKFSKLPENILKQRKNIAIEMAGLSHLLNHDAASLSGGERQRLAIARAWIIQPKLLLLDEPVSNMDARSHDLVLTMLKVLQEQGTGMLISSHQHSGLTELCHAYWHIVDKQITSSIYQAKSLSFEEELTYATPN